MDLFLLPDPQIYSGNPLSTPYLETKFSFGINPAAGASESILCCLLAELALQ